METSDRPVWRKSSYSDNNGGACVEVANRRESVMIRDSKDPGDTTLRFTPTAWSAFVSHVKAHG